MDKWMNVGMNDEEHVMMFSAVCIAAIRVYGFVKSLAINQLLTEMKENQNGNALFQEHCVLYCARNAESSNIVYYIVPEMQSP